MRTTTTVLCIIIYLSINDELKLLFGAWYHTAQKYDDFRCVQKKTLK